MILVNKTLQDIVLIGENGSVTLEPSLVTTVDDSFKDLPILSIYKEKGLIAVSGGLGDTNDDVEKVADEIAKEANTNVLDLPPEVKEDLRRFEITVSNEMSEEAILNRLKEGKVEHDALIAEAKEKGVKVHYKNTISTLKEKIGAEG